MPLRDLVTGDIFVLTPPKKSLKAWQPLDDCVVILFEFQNMDVDDEHTEWRILWVAGIALLRAIGHVLAKSDMMTSGKHKLEIDRLWHRWKAHPDDSAIFWEFVEEERNNLLKTYEFGAALAHDENGFYVRYGNGENAFDLFRAAVYWWRHQLMLLEDRI